MKTIYDKVYKEEATYNTDLKSPREIEYEKEKQDVIDKWIDSSHKILDVGCGTGHNLKKLFNKGCDVFGIELSEECCNRYLKDLPHKCISVLDFCKENEELYDSILCMDFLEHIPYEDLQNVIKGLSDISNRALFGIANSPSIHCEFELHIIQENAEWWIDELKKYYSQVELIALLNNDSFFFMKVEK